MQSGSPRLMLFALQREQPEGAENFVASLQYNQALQQPQGARPVLLSYRADLRPIIAYDGNINAGIPGDTFYIGGTPFTINADDRAKAGMVFGLETSLTTRLALGPGRTLDLSAYAAQSHSFDHDMDILNAATSACGAQFLGHARWIELCIGNRFTQRDDRPETERIAALSATKIFASGFGLHEARVTLQHSWHDDYHQPSVALQVITARAGMGALSLRMDASARVQGQNTRLFGTSAALTRPIAGAVTTLFLGYGYDAGDSVLGQVRRDSIVSLGISRAATRHADATLRLSKRESTLAAYDEFSIDLDLSLLDFDF